MGIPSDGNYPCSCHEWSLEVEFEPCVSFSYLVQWTEIWKDNEGKAFQVEQRRVQVRRSWLSFGDFGIIQTSKTSHELRRDLRKAAALGALIGAFWESLVWEYFHLVGLLLVVKCSV